MPRQGGETVTRFPAFGVNSSAIHAQAPPEGLRESLRSFRSFAQAGILQSRAPACSDPASNPGVAL